MHTNEKIRPVLEHQTDRKEINFNDSIPQSTQAEKLSIEMEHSEIIECDLIGLDSFLGNVRSFKLYLKAQLIFLEAGIIAP